MPYPRVPYSLDQELAKCDTPHGKDDGLSRVVGFPFLGDWSDRRLAAINGEIAVRDPWKRVLETPFHLGPRDLLSRANQAPPNNPQPTVSSFTEWIYSLYVPAEHSRAKEKGAAAEVDILECKTACSRAKAFMQLPRDWRLVHCCMDDAGAVAYEIPALRVGGKPLRGCPDLVYAHQLADALLILEVKFSMRPVPANLWPNVWAQLWAYAHIPRFACAASIDVVGEVWGHNHGSWQQYRHNHPVYLRHAARRDPRKSSYDRFFRELFEAFGGEIDQHAMAHSIAARQP